MDDGKAKKLHLPIAALAIAVLPILVISLSSAFVHWFGTFAGEFTVSPKPSHAEAAGRLRTMTTWLAMFAAVFFCLVYFAQSLRRFERDSLRTLLVAYAALAVAGLVLVYFGFAGQANRAIAEQFIQRSLELPIHHPPNRGPLDLIRFNGTEYQLLLGMNSIQRYLLALLTPALVLGSISCLAMPPDETVADCRRQAQRLSTYLYLSAAVLVTGLIFLAAMLRWPGYGLAEAAAKSYNAHVDAYVFYWGVTYSILIASYYVPIAVRLAGISGVAAPASDDEKRSRRGDQLPSDRNAEGGRGPVRAGHCRPARRCLQALARRADPPDACCRHRPRPAARRRGRSATPTGRPMARAARRRGSR